MDDDVLFLYVAVNITCYLTFFFTALVDTSLLKIVWLMYYGHV